MRRRMKHILGILLSLSLCCSMSLFSSCSADPTGAQTTDADDTKQIIAVSATQAASQLLAAGNWSEEMIPLKDSRIISVYGVNEADFSTCAAYCSPSGAYAEELAVFVAKDAQSAQNIEAVLAAYRTEQSTYWKNYRADQATKIENALLRRYGNAVIFCACENTAPLSSVIDHGFVS